MLVEDTAQECPTCHSTEIKKDYQRAEFYCDICGTVLDENLIDQGPDWRAFNNEQRNARTRVGAPSTPTIADKGLTTEIDWRNKDSNGRNISVHYMAQMQRLRKWNKRLRVSRAGERNLAFALSELDRVSSNLDLPKPVRKDASVIYRDAAANKLIRGRSIEGIVAAAIYTACRLCNIPRTLNEISNVSEVSKKQLGKNYRFLSRELNIKLKPTSPKDYIPRFASNLGLSGQVQSKAIEIIKKSKELGVNSGRDPSGVAAAALYISSILLGEKMTQKNISEVSGVTEVTIRNIYKELTENIDIGVVI